MRKKAWMFLGAAVLLSAAGMLLRVVELRTALDTSAMVMDFVPVSAILLVLSALAVGLFALMARKLTEAEVPHSYIRCFGSPGSLAVSAAALLLSVAGALLCMKARQTSGSSVRIYLAALALLAVLGGAGWLALGLDVRRGKKEDSFLAAVAPVFFVGCFLVVYYKCNAQLPALLYNLYPFLGLCAALGALHLIAGFAVERLRPRLTLFLAGSGCYLCAVSLVGVSETAYRLFFAAIALELAAHGTALLLPHPPEPPQPEAEKEETAPVTEAEAEDEDEVAPAEEAEAESEE